MSLSFLQQCVIAYDQATIQKLDGWERALDKVKAQILENAKAGNREVFHNFKNKSEGQEYVDWLSDRLEEFGFSVELVHDQTDNPDSLKIWGWSE
jgi:hypothetical protein